MPDNKNFTFIITSNRKGQTRSVTVSAAWLKASIAIAIVTLVFLAAASVDYFGLLLEQGENKLLHAENDQLSRQFQVVESKLSSLESSLERIKTLTTKIKLITNIEDEDRVMKLSLGSSSRIEQSLSDFEYDGDHDERAPAGEFLKSDSMFLEKPPLDEIRGELAATRNHDYANLSIRIDRAVKNSALREQGVIRLQELLQERQSILNATPNIKPARGWFTSRFGYRIDPFTGKSDLHLGLDIASASGTPIMAPADGVVSYVGYEAGYGKIVAIDHGFGVRTRYAHNSQLYVELGQKVKRRDIISAVGSTGRSSGPHLHYEVRINDVPVDPINYILDE
ncbi:MAG: cell wall-binding protein associated metalloendopeptidase [Bdellovibrionales bacterium RBG_16_40_8]|nr:MAG: cell wall-binding protein associated metalloendopeptidase [Bdellovibrionales bacterium RBG_16_40_8]